MARPFGQVGRLFPQYVPRSRPIAYGAVPGASFSERIFSQVWQTYYGESRGSGVANFPYLAATVQSGELEPSR